MAKKMTGMIVQFGTKGYGFILGDDDKKYFVHQKNVHNKSRLDADTRVIFEPQDSEKGWVATKVKLEDTLLLSLKPLSAITTKVLFSVLFVAQIIVIYKVFISS